MFKRRRRSKKREAEALGSLIFIGLIFGVISLIFSAVQSVFVWTLAFIGTTNGKITLAALTILLIGAIYLKIRKSVADKNEMLRLQEIDEQNELARQRAIGSISPSTNRSDYLVEDDDYRRGNPKENFYRKTFALYLLETFSNCCAKCGDQENGVDIDHFIFSKNEGGCFIMRHREGHLVNNAIPLCRTCNRSKSDASYKSFYTDEELPPIFEKNLKITKRLNEKVIFGTDGKILKQKKAS